MKAAYRFFCGITLFALVPAVCFVACAQGNDVDQTASGPTTGAGSGSSGSSGSGSPLPPGKIGGDCVNQEDCTEGTCTDIGPIKVCTRPCPPDCPLGTYCAIIEGDPICVPDLDQQCTQCTGSIDCKSPSDQCLKAPAGDKFCAIDCSTTSFCPNGFTCVVGADYLSGMSSSGGPADAGADASADGGDAGNADGGMDAGAPPPGVSYKFCVPNSGGSCPCNAKRDGVKRTCGVKNSSGECKGSESCNGMSGKWEGCDAKTPVDETCNSKDDNCDGQLDEGDDNALCAASGPPPPHAGWSCSNGLCSVGPCESGYTVYPPGAPDTDGCTCAVDSGEPNETCGSATNAGSVSDTGAPMTIVGTLSSDTDVDTWMFTATDTPENGTNSYHVSVILSAPMPNDEFQMDVLRGACNDAPVGPMAAITSYSWCVDGTFAGPNGAEGEGACSPQGAVHCNDNTSAYYVRVYRKAGAAATCTPYQLTVSATSGDPCDFSMKCP